MPTTISSPKASHPQSLRRRFKNWLLGSVGSVRRFVAALAFGALIAGSPVPAGAVPTSSQAYAGYEFNQAEAVSSLFIQQDDVRKAFGGSREAKWGASDRLMNDLTSFISKNTDLNAVDIAKKVFDKIEMCYSVLKDLPNNRFFAFIDRITFRSIFSERRKQNSLNKNMEKFSNQADGLYDAYNPNYASFNNEDVVDDNPLKILEFIQKFLTARQLQVLEMRIEGHTLDYIAESLKIKKVTVKSHITKARARLAKLDIKNRYIIASAAVA